MQKVFWFLATIFLVWAIFSSSIYIVEPGQVWLIKTLWELKEETKTEGFYFKKPIIDDIVKISIRNKKIEKSVNSASKDLQEVSSSIAVNYSISRQKVVNLFREVWGQRDIETVLINPAIEEVVKAVTANFNASEVITQRELASISISEWLKRKLEDRGLILNEINIVNFNFSPEFNKAIEQKVKAEQEALTEKNRLEKVKFQAQQEIERSKAEAEKIRIQAESITKQGGQEYIKLQWIQKWDWKLPTHILWEDSNLMLPINSK